MWCEEQQTQLYHHASIVLHMQALLNANTIITSTSKNVWSDQYNSTQYIPVCEYSLGLLRTKCIYWIVYSNRHASDLLCGGLAHSETVYTYSAHVTQKSRLTAISIVFEIHNSCGGVVKVWEQNMNTGYTVHMQLSISTYKCSYTCSGFCMWLKVNYVLIKFISNEYSDCMCIGI